MSDPSPQPDFDVVVIGGGVVGCAVARGGVTRVCREMKSCLTSMATTNMCMSTVSSTHRMQAQRIASQAFAKRINK